MSKRETPKTDALDNELVQQGHYDHRHLEMLQHAYDLERENARLKEELEEAHRNAAGIARNFATEKARAERAEQALAEKDRIIADMAGQLNAEAAVGAQDAARLERMTEALTLIELESRDDGHWGTREINKAARAVL